MRMLILVISTLLPVTGLAQNLEERELGEPYLEEGEPVVYERALPFLAQEVLDLGFELPLPYGAQLIGYWQEQDLILENLFISINDGPVEEIDFVDFGTPSVMNATAQAKLDAWLFPFMNVYASFGTFTGDANVPLAIEGRDILEYLGLGGLCNGGPLEPALCNRLLSATAKPDYNGQSVVLGTILATGWSRYFVTIPISYAWTEVNILNETVTALNVSPRFGILHETSRYGTIAAYVGATYLRADVDISGTVVFDTSDSNIPGVDRQTVIDYTIRQRNKDRWNALAGLNWEVSKSWSFQAELGFGGSRSNLIASATYRW